MSLDNAVAHEAAALYDEALEAVLPIALAHALAGTVNPAGTETRRDQGRATADRVRVGVRTARRPFGDGPG